MKKKITLKISKNPWEMLILKNFFSIAPWTYNLDKNEVVDTWESFLNDFTWILTTQLGSYSVFEF